MAILAGFVVKQVTFVSQFDALRSRGMFVHVASEAATRLVLVAAFGVSKRMCGVDFAQLPRVWGFAFDEVFDDLLSQFVDLTEHGHSAWVLIPVRGVSLARLRVPDGYTVTVGE